MATRFNPWLRLTTALRGDPNGRNARRPGDWSGMRMEPAVRPGGQLDRRVVTGRSEEAEHPRIWRIP